MRGYGLGKYYIPCQMAPLLCLRSVLHTNTQCKHVLNSSVRLVMGWKVGGDPLEHCTLSCFNATKVVSLRRLG